MKTNAWLGRSSTVLLFGLFSPACSPHTSDRDARRMANAITAPSPTPPGPAASSSASTAGVRLRSQLLGVLGGYEHIVGKEELVRLGSPQEITDGLAAIYTDPTVQLAVRVQALTSLRFFPSAQAKEIFEQALTSSATSDVARRAGVKAYTAGFGDQAVPILEQLLSHPDVHTRNAVARAFGELRGESALSALRRRLPEEHEPLVKATIESSLAR